MSWSVEVLDRDSGRFLNSPESCVPTRLSWDDFSGPSKALIRCPYAHLGMEDWRMRLGQDVRVYDSQGRLAWWGCLDQVRQVQGELQRTVGMDEVANRVAVRFNDLGGAEPGQISQTDWVENLESQAIYGIKEIVFQVGFTLPETAEWIASARLKERAFPEVKLAPHAPGSTETPGACYLECRGWMQTLDWRIWPGLRAVTGHSPTQQGVQAVGNALTNRKVAQSFQVSEALQFKRLAVRARKQGNPTDALRFSLQADLNGRPSGLELGAQSLSAGELSGESYRWVEVSLPAHVSLAVNTSYWLILERSSGVDSSNHYLLGLDENLGYWGGSLLLYDQISSTWKSRTTDADLLFHLTGELDQIEQMRRVVSCGGQFLKQLEFEPGQSRTLPPLGDEGQDCLQVFHALLKQGNAALEPLCAGIDPNRNLRVWKKPKAGSATLRLCPDGSLQTPFGQPLKAPWQAVGQWLYPGNARPLYLSSLSLEPVTGRITLNDR